MRKIERSKYLNWIIVILIFGFTVFLAKIYYSFYKDVKEVKDSILRYNFENGPLSLPVANNDYVSIWGAFGDFIGGTLNPILSFFSVVLILWTINQNRKMLDNSSDALKSNMEMQDEVKKNTMLQILDNRVFSILDSLAELETRIKEKDFDLFYNNIMKGDLNFEGQYNQIFFNKNKDVIYFLKKTEFLFDMINSEIYSNYEADLNGFKKYQEKVLENKNVSEYVYSKIFNSAIERQSYFDAIRFLSNEEYEYKELYKKTKEFEVVCSINNLINRYILIIKSSISIEMQQFLVIYSSFKNDLQKKMIAYGFLNDILLCDVANSFEKEYVLSNNMICSVLKQKDYYSKGDLSEFYYDRDKFSLHDNLHDIEIYNFLFVRSAVSYVKDISDINRRLFDEIDEIEVNDYLNNIKFTISLDLEAYNFILKINEVGCSSPIVYTNKGARFEIFNKFYYVDLDGEYKPIILNNEYKEIFTQRIQFKKENPS